MEKHYNVKLVDVLIKLIFWHLCSIITLPWHASTSQGLRTSEGGPS